MGGCGLLPEMACNIAQPTPVILDVRTRMATKKHEKAQESVVSLYTDHLTLFVPLCAFLWPSHEHCICFRFKDLLNHNRRFIPLRLDDTTT